MAYSPPQQEEWKATDSPEQKIAVPSGEITNIQVTTYNYVVAGSKLIINLSFSAALGIMKLPTEINVTLPLGMQSAGGATFTAAALIVTGGTSQTGLFEVPPSSTVLKIKRWPAIAWLAGACTCCGQIIVEVAL